jgi:hypothetical protein
MKTSGKLNPKFLIFASLMVVAALAFVPAAAIAKSSSQFDVPMVPNYTARTPTNYQFGTGDWAGNLVYTQHHWILNSKISLSGATPNTWYLLRMTYVDGSGRQLYVFYWAMWTDSNGNAATNMNSKVPNGAAAVCLGVYDASNFFPPLQTMISDPEIGGDEPT